MTKPARQTTRNTKETRTERRRRLREEYRDALAEYRSFHPDNVTPAYLRAKERLFEAEKALAWWRF